MQEGGYHEQAQAHWMRIARIWQPEKECPTDPRYPVANDPERVRSIERLFDEHPLERIPPLYVTKMVGAPYQGMYELIDGHHRCREAQIRGIEMLLVEVFGLKSQKGRMVLLASTSPIIFDSVCNL